MATIKANGQTYFIDSTKITTPSIKINGSGYIPLFSGNKGGTVDYNRWRYTLGGLKVGNLRAAVSRSFINSAPAVSIGASSTRLPNSYVATITAYASDPDGDAVEYDWGTGVFSGNSSITVVGRDRTNTYRCRVRDQYGAVSSWSNQVSITWYEPNRAPYVGITSYTNPVEAGNNIGVWFNYYDVDGDYVTIEYGWGHVISPNVVSYHRTGSFGASGVTSARSAYVEIPTSGATTYNGAYRIYVLITDSKGAICRSERDVGAVVYNFKAKVKTWYQQNASSYGGYSTYMARVTSIKIARGYNDFCLAYGRNWYHEATASRSGFSMVTIYPIHRTISSHTESRPYKDPVTVYDITVNYVGPAKSIAVNNSGEWIAAWS